MLRADDAITGDPQLWEIADAIHTGRDVDWSEMESSAPAVRRPLIHRLKLISEIFNAHKAEMQQIDATQRRSTNPPPETAKHNWGPLEVLEKIGEGAFGEVYRARDPRLDRQVALKLFRPHRLRLSQVTSDVIEEGRLLARVNHPNVVTVHGAENLDGRFGIWMEYIAGSTLEEIIAEQGPLEAVETMMIGQDLCRALTAVHAAGVIHRDVKARNVMREESSRIVLMDLGVSCEIDRQIPIQQYGTPLYAAPEVLRTDAATWQTDVYSVGVLLFYALTGQYPVIGSTLAEIKEAHETGRYRRLLELRPDLAETFLDVVDLALAPDPARRFASAAQFEQALATALEADARQQQAAFSRQTGKSEASVHESAADEDQSNRQTMSHTRDQQAYNRYLQGLYFFDRRYRGGKTVTRAAEYFQQAIDTDSEFALPYIGLADCWNMASFFQYVRPLEGFPKARVALKRALALDPELGEAYASLGYLGMYFDWDFVSAERHFHKAMELNPRYVLTYQWYAMLLSAMGRHDDAMFLQSARPI